MSMSRYDEDADSGDISLSLSKSSPQLSTILASGAGPSRYRDVAVPPSSPTPNRLLGKNLWPRPVTDDPEDHDGDRDRDRTPTGSLFRSDERRASSAGLNGEGAHGSPTRFTRRTSSSNTITTVSRSRSMNVRLPSVDLSAGSGSASGSGSGTRRNDDAGTGNGSGNGAVGRTPSMRVGWSRRPGEARPPPLVPEQVIRRMGRWVKEIVVCNFDLERGPVVERRVMGRRWGPGEKENVAFSSFPDTSLFAEGDIQFSFKIRQLPVDTSLPEPASPMPGRTFSSESANPMDRSGCGLSGSPMNGNVNGHGARHPAAIGKEEKAEEYRKWDERGREWLYGFVWFEQRRDGGIARGYMQKSLVILTHLPFPALFASVLDRIAPVFFEHGYSALEAACHAIATWPDPSSDALLDLPLLSEVITVKLPDTSDTPQVALTATIAPSVPRPILASLPPSSPLRSFSALLPSLWSVWECLILAEPVLVIAPDPKTCSEIVWWLRDLLRPIPPAGDFRPYLHIHDHDFSLLVNSNKPQPGVVVGVTNPFFRNAASHWPNVISIPSPKPRRTVNGAAGKIEQPEGFISRRHRSVQKDRPLLKRLETLAAQGEFDGIDALRTHFQQLTEKMLVPLNRYFQTLVPPPSPNPTAPAASNVPIKPFSLPAFLAHLKTRGPNPLAFRNRGLMTKARVESDFYTSFCMSPTFAGWLASRVDSLGLAVAAQTQSSALGLPTAGSVADRRAASLGITSLSSLSIADLRVQDEAADAAGAGTSSPSQWSSEGDPRMSSDGSSVGQWGEEPVRRR